MNHHDALQFLAEIVLTYLEKRSSGFRRACP
jgi:hypothetical protein